MFVHIDPDSKLAKIILVLGIPFFATVLWFQLASFSCAYRSQNWPTAGGVIAESRVERLWGIHGPHSELRIRYTYVVAGKRLQNDTVAFGLCRGCMTWGHADRKAGQYPKGRVVKVFYDPDNPELACLEPGGLGWEDGFMLLVYVSSLVLGMKELRNFARWLLAMRSRVFDSACESLGNSSYNGEIKGIPIISDGSWRGIGIQLRSVENHYTRGRKSNPPVSNGALSPIHDGAGGKTPSSMSDCRRVIACGLLMQST
jgi:hypothetical protein